MNVFTNILHYTVGLVKKLQVEVEVIGNQGEKNSGCFNPRHLAKHEPKHKNWKVSARKGKDLLINRQVFRWSIINLL